MPASRSRRVAPRTPPSLPGPADPLLPHPVRARKSPDQLPGPNTTGTSAHADAQTASVVPIGRPGPPHRVPVEDVAPVTPPSRRGDPGFGGLPLLHEKTQQRRPHPSPQSNGSAAHHANPAAARRGGFFDRGPCPSQDPGPPPLPRPDPSGSCHPKGDPDLTPDGPGDSRSTGPGCLPCQGPTGRRTRGRERTDDGPAAQPGGSHAHHHRASPSTRAAGHRVPVRGRVQHEAGFSTTGPHPQGGVAIARSIDDARQRLADMLIFCDPAAAAVADITAFTRAGHHARPPPAAAENPDDAPMTPPDPGRGSPLH